jgi:hypothetical protein
MKSIGGRILVLFLILGTGCAPMREIDISIMQPARITLPLYINQIAFLNRSVVPRLLHSDSSKWTAEEYYILDTIMNNWIFQGVRQSLKASPLYDLDSITIIRARRNDTTGLLTPMTVRQMNRLKKVHPADAVISLEYYDIIDSSRVYMVFTGEDTEYPIFMMEAYLGLYTTAAWRIYDLTRDTVFDQHLIRDTLTWYHQGETVEEAVYGLPESVDALRSAAFNVGALYGDRISPGWTETQRYYHASGGKEMRQASIHAQKGEWEEAAEIWKKLSNGDRRWVAAHASFNMALVCEINDEIIDALDWAIKSYSIRQEDLTREYIDLLKERYEDRRKLNKQVPYEPGI